MVERALLRRLRDAPGRPFVLGLCGAQGSGKSTIAAALELRLRGAGLRAAVLSLDDLYLPREAREALARDVHPLLRTRGVPGTHEVALGLATLDSLAAGVVTALPRFDKARDTRAEIAAWPRVEGCPDVLLFEGWCVGAVPQAEDALVEPVNRLEREQDGDGRWRRFVNDALGGDYRALFDRIDMQVLLAAPDFGVVTRWRTEQEHALRRQLGQQGRPTAGVMSDAAVAGFVAYYERLTRHILTEMPARADLVIRLGHDREIIR